MSETLRGIKFSGQVYGWTPKSGFYCKDLNTGKVSMANQISTVGGKCPAKK